MPMFQAALLTRMSQPPKRSTTAATAASIDDSSRWSRAIVWASTAGRMTAAAVASAPAVLPT